MRFLFWCQGWQFFYKEFQLSGHSLVFGGRKNCEDGGTGEKSSDKLRLITLMSRARAGDPEGLCRPPSFGFNSVSYTVFDAHRLKCSRRQYRSEGTLCCPCTGLTVQPWPLSLVIRQGVASGFIIYYSPLFCMPQLHSHVFSCLPGSSCPCQKTQSFVSSQRVS